MNRIWIAIIVPALVLSAVANAGVIEEANAAFNRGETAHALTIITTAADHGDIAAQRALAAMYDVGRGVQKDREQSFKWLLKAANAGDAEAQFLVGNAYKAGDGALKDEAEGLVWRRKAADNGYVPAQVALGYDYTYGFGVQRNSIEAVRLFRSAALAGDAFAQNFLGEAYATGRGIDRNDHDAQKWFMKAAEQGLSAAQFNLGNLYLHSGAQTKTDPVLGYMWLEVASQQKDSAAAFARDAAAKRLTSAELKKARALAAACVSTHYKNCMH